MRRNEINRKLSHIFSALAPFSFLMIFNYFGEYTFNIILLIFGIFTILFVAIDFLRRYSSILQKIFIFLSSHSMRDTEIKNQRLTGASWLLIAFYLVLYIFPLEYAVPSCIILSFSDTAAAIIGINFGKHKWYKQYSIEGSVAFIIVGLLVLFIFLPEINFWLALLVVTAATIGEGVIPIIDDNISIPFICATILYFLY
ncbi:MAG: hypothetical protein U9R41_02925 [Candidatus Marinimicrobia bacterium]|nr:hypothetical protein [Candidatus Neomarinimicrobiota bacterium]